MFKVPNQYRKRNGMFATDDSNGNSGVFYIPLESTITAICVASEGSGWEHVSVHMDDNGKEETPTWDEMCMIKDLFWGKEDCVIQFHPPESEYVNVHKYCLHLWRPMGMEIPMPPTIMV